VDAVTVEMTILPSDMRAGEPGTDVQTVSTCAAEVVDALNVPLGGFASQG